MAYQPWNLGQQPMSSSRGIVIASDQSPVSVAGTVNAVQSGTVITSIAGIPQASVHGTVNTSILGTVPVTESGTWNVSIISTIPSSVIVGASIFGQLPGGTAVVGSIAALQGTNPWIITGSIQGGAGTQYIEDDVVPSVTGTAVMFRANQSSSVMDVVSPSAPLPVIGSVSGTVGASIIGLTPVAVTNTPSVSGTVLIGNTNVNVSGSVVASGIVSINPASVSGTIGASIIGLPPVKLSDGTETLDFYEENQIDASVIGVAMMFKSNISSSIISVVTPSTPLPIIGSVSGSVGITGNPSISGTVNIGVIPGSIIAYQGTSPWAISSIYGNISGSVVATISGTPNVNTAGSVIAFQGTNPWVTGSIVGTYAEDAGHTAADKGLFVFGVRNDAIASFVSANLDYSPIGVDSAGRNLIKPFVSEDGAIISYVGSVVSTSVTLVRASAVGLRNYITDYWVANTGSVATLITFQDGSTSILGRTIAPAGGGSNSQGIAIPLKTAPAQDLAFVAGTSTSVLHMTIKGYQAP